MVHSILVETGTNYEMISKLGYLDLAACGHHLLQSPQLVVDLVPLPLRCQHAKPNISNNDT
jgi:hypothetical protein